MDFRFKRNDGDFMFKTSVPYLWDVFPSGENVEIEYVLLGDCDFYQMQLFESPNNLYNLVKFLNII